MTEPNAAALADELKQAIERAAADFYAPVVSLQFTQARAIVAALRAKSPASPGDGGAEPVAWIQHIEGQPDRCHTIADSHDPRKISWKPHPRVTWTLLYAAPPQAEQAKRELCRQCGLPWITNTVHLHPLKQPAEARTERGERDGAAAANLRRLILEHERSEGHAAGFAEGKSAAQTVAWDFADKAVREEYRDKVLQANEIADAIGALQPKEGGR